MMKVLAILELILSIVIGAVVSMIWLFLVIGMACVWGLNEFINNK